MSTFSLLFLTALGLSLLIRLWLNQRQIKHVQQHRAHVPEEFQHNINLENHQRAADYTLCKARFGRWDLLLEPVLLLIWTFGGGLEWLDQLWQSSGWSTIATGIGVILSLTVIGALLDLPFNLYRTFVIEEKFGFNKTTPTLFIQDMLKGTLLMLLLGLPLISVVLWLMSGAGEHWWLYTWLVWMGFNLFILWAYPSIIAPLFNTFSPLEEGALKARIDNLLQRCGFNSNGIFVVDGSKRSGHGNAYFSGFGRNKRIVFFDTLLESLSPSQVEAVLAHELGHFKRKHVLKNIVLMATMSLAGLALLAWLMASEWFYSSLGISTPSTHIALLLFMLIMPVFSFFLQPLTALFSRKHEFEADEFAAQNSSAEELITALVRLYRENASTLTPDPLYSSFYDSHPPASIRIAHLNQLKGVSS
ncbi:MAG: M48 family metallopeptidase [Gammaproteobacteria bacterium]|nr:M48 family metallopeptidase [Gammaproteobacteria bacterium]